MKLDNAQQAAIEFACKEKFAIITGGAGAGKTTIIEQIAHKVRNPALCAFAGKAAARLKEATGHEACTIHRLLKSNGEIFMAGSLDCMSVIIDEGSMLSSVLLAEIIKRKPARLVLVGDEAQLPPVGKGQPFHDIIALRPNKMVRLEKCYRNKAAVFKAALEIRAGRMPLEQDSSEGENWSIQHTGGKATTQAYILKLISTGVIDFGSDVILCPRNGDGPDSLCTVKGLNAAIKDLVNPSDEPFAVGDRVINTKNCADENVWNGTTGEVHAINSEGEVWVKLDIPITNEAESTESEKIYTDKVLFDKEMKKHLQLAYAMTVHKAQGSQYRRVVFCCLERDAFILDRSLIYTAVTRAQQGCCVVGQKGAFWRGIQTARSKNTVIQELAK